MLNEIYLFHKLPVNWSVFSLVTILQHHHTQLKADIFE